MKATPSRCESRRGFVVSYGMSILMLTTARKTFSTMLTEQVFYMRKDISGKTAYEIGCLLGFQFYSLNLTDMYHGMAHLVD